MFKEEYKGYYIESDGTFSMKVIKPKGAGNMPKALKGSFTNSNFAKKSIDNYLANRNKGSNSNGKGTSTA